VKSDCANAVRLLNVYRGKLGLEGQVYYQGESYRVRYLKLKDGRYSWATYDLAPSYPAARARTRSMARVSRRHAPGWNGYAPAYLRVRKRIIAARGAAA